jgi:hypothetical protein
MFQWFFKLFRKKYPTKSDLPELQGYDESTCYLCGTYIGKPKKEGQVAFCCECVIKYQIDL